MEKKAHLVLIGSICLSDVPKEAIKTAKNGKEYLNLAVFELNEISKYGNSHIITCEPKKEERVEGHNYLIGNFKNYSPGMFANNKQNSYNKNSNKQEFINFHDDKNDEWTDAPF